MRIAISSDHGGNNLRREIMQLLDELQISYEDFGPQSADSVDYQTMQNLYLKVLRTENLIKAF